MEKVINLFRERDGESTITGIKPGDRLMLPNGDEYSLRWNDPRQALELVKSYSDNEGAICVYPATSNHIYIK